MSTLIVRDATMAVNGAPETRGDPAHHLRSRLQEVGTYDPKTYQQFVEVLNASAVGEESDPEVLEALMILGLSQPQLANQLGISSLNVGRRLAARFERLGETETAIAVLELLIEHHPGQRALERDLAALMRRQGMVQDLVERYQERANKLLRVGRVAEAIEWYREILLMDRSRKDVARMIRDLRYSEVADKKGRQRRWRGVLMVLFLSVGLSALVLREVELRRLYTLLPKTSESGLPALRDRLAALEEFINKHPVWHGSLLAVRERSDLRAKVKRMEGSIEKDLEQARLLHQKRLEDANLARDRGILKADSADAAGAVEEFRKALSIAPEDWEHRERTERDIQALQSLLEADSQ